MIEDGRNGMKAWNAGGELCGKRKAMLRGIVDLRYLVKGLRIEEERDDNKGVHIEEENCVKRKYVLRGHVDLKEPRVERQDCRGMEGGSERNVH